MKNYYELVTLLRIVLMLVLFLVTCAGICLLYTRTRKRSVTEQLMVVLCCIVNGVCMILYAADVRILKYEMSEEPFSTWLCEKPVVYTVLLAMASVVFLFYVGGKGPELQ